MTVDVDVRFTWWHFFISSYYLSVSNEISFTALKSEEFTQSSGSFNWWGGGGGGSICLWCLHIFSMCWYVLICLSNGHSLTALKSIGVTQSSGSFWGVHLPVVSTCFLYALVFPYIFLLFDCFKWALIDCTEKRRGHSELWQFQMVGGSICLWCLHVFSMHWYFLIFSYYLTVSNGFSLTVWKHIAVTFSSSSLKLGGTICLWHLYPYIYWYFLIFSNKLTVSNGFSLTVWKRVAVTFSSSSFKWGGPSAFGISMFSLQWYFLISSYYLTVLNGHSLTAVKSREVTQSSDSFTWGREGGSSMDTHTN